MRGEGERGRVMMDTEFFAIGAGVLIVGFFVMQRAFPRLLGWPILIAAAAWGLVAARQWWLSVVYDPQEYNIDVYFLLIIAALLVITVLCVAVSLIPVRRPK